MSLNNNCNNANINDLDNINNSGDFNNFGDFNDFNDNGFPDDLENVAFRNGNIMQTGNGRCCNCIGRCNCRPVCCCCTGQNNNNNNTPPMILASLFSTRAQTVHTDTDIIFNRSNAITSGMYLNQAGTELKIRRSGYYNISFGVDAHGIVGSPEVHLSINHAPADGTRLRIASTNVMNALTKIILLRAGDVIKLREKGGTLVLDCNSVNAFLDINLIGR